MKNQVTRRDFIKIGGAGLLGLAFRDFPPGGDPARKRPPSFALGRTVYSIRYYEKPTYNSAELGYYITDTVVNINEERLGDPEPFHNPIWLRTDDGWLHSSYIQPVQQLTNPPVSNFPNGKMLFEVTMPYTQAWSADENTWERSYRFYYGSTHWAHHAFIGANGEYWYKILDDRYGGYHMVSAKDMRPVQAAELTPISPGTPGKRIEINLDKQRLVAYEGNRPVFTARIATGYFEGDTPLGEFIVERKQPSRHMASRAPGSEFDLPGVPWVCYISWTGVSLHGTYWHNNYGTPQSHGCINLSPGASKWIYRWTEPFVPVEDDYVETTEGTRVVVV